MVFSERFNLVFIYSSVFQYFYRVCSDEDIWRIPPMLLFAYQDCELIHHLHIHGLMFGSVGRAKVFSHSVLLLSPGGIDRLSSSAILVLKKKLELTCSHFLLTSWSFVFSLAHWLFPQLMKKRFISINSMWQFHTISTHCDKGKRKARSLSPLAHLSHIHLLCCAHLFAHSLTDSLQSSW